MPTPSAVLLFDGVCNLCNGLVQFVIQRDTAGYFQFASLQSAAGRALLAEHGVQPSSGAPDTVMLLEHNRLYTHSTAALRITRHLGGGWPLFYALLLVPRFLRDAAYRFVARHRYQWFGQSEACMLPTPELRQRFLA